MMKKRKNSANKLGSVDYSSGSGGGGKANTNPHPQHQPVVEAEKEISKSTIFLAFKP